MASIHIFKKSLRGIVSCSKCGKIILRGEKYFKATPYRREPIIRCFNCGLKQYETSASLYIKKVGDIKYNWKRKYPICSTVVDDIISDIEIIKDDVEDSLYNLPEQFQDDSILQERLDNIEDCLDELESIDVSSYENEEKIDEGLLKADIDNAINILLLK